MAKRVTLRAYQRTAVREILGHFETGRRPLLVAPGGSGKSVLIAELARHAVSLGGCVLILAHRREILRQLRAAAVSSGIPEVGALYPGASAPVGVRAVTVASQQLLSRWTSKRDLPRADVVLVDEAHHVAARTYARLLDSYPRASLAGFTATPIRLDGRPLGAHFDEIVIGGRTGELVRDGYLGSPRVFIADEEFLPDLENLRAVSGDYPTAQLRERVTDGGIVGEIVTNFCGRLPTDATGIAFAVTVGHAHAIAARFNVARIRAEVVTAETPTAVRDGLRARLRSGETQVAVSVDVLSEGFDLPEVDAVILARPTCSLCLYLQQIGRALRPRGERPAALILDHARNVPRFGLPDAERTYSLATGVDPISLEDLPRVCPACHAVVDVGESLCPECGAEMPTCEPRREPDEDPGVSLVELTAKKLQDLRARLREHCVRTSGEVDEVWVARALDLFRSAGA